MAVKRVEPTGERRDYTPDQIFFSTTDKRGMIVTVNSTFVELSRFAEDELVGEPHNIIRHPDMPGAVFHIMWERLLAGQSMMGYVQNLARDGAYYLTFSTVTPLSEGFISVRSAVTRPDLWEPVSRAYAHTRALENKWRRGGMPRAQAASQGAEDLGARLAALGFPTYDDVIRAVVPAEVDERRRLAPPHAPPTAPGQPLHEVVLAIGAVDRELMTLRARYEDATEVAASLDSAQAAFVVTLEGLEDAAAAAADAAATVGTAAPAAAKTAQAALSLAVTARKDLAPLAPLLAEVRGIVLDLRASLALSVLHNDMALTFARDAASGSSVGDPQGTVVLLGETVSASVRQGEVMSQRVREELGQVVASIHEAHEALMSFQRMLTNWRHVVVRSGVSQRLGALVDPIDSRLSAGLTEMNDLDRLAQRCATLALTLESAALREAAEGLVIAARRL
ncbi:PAS domain-containing protein [Demequina sp.]|uniref:PAS domain-containing protein n=1 Tax=Demequina sp. TaxID=2050685 RepID=UPI0025C39AD7|nr:PAS domain-containing protein [Demequina sp.]